jgi:hypothetical protein
MENLIRATSGPHSRLSGTQHMLQYGLDASIRQPCDSISKLQLCPYKAGTRLEQFAHQYRAASAP